MEQYQPEMVKKTEEAIRSICSACYSALKCLDITQDFNIILPEAPAAIVTFLRKEKTILLRLMPITGDDKLKSRVVRLLERIDTVERKLKKTA